MGKVRTLTDKSLRNFLKRDSRSLLEIAEHFNVSPVKIRKMLLDLKEGSYNIIEEGEGDKSFSLGVNLNKGVVKKELDYRMWQGDTLKFGFTSDNHLCNKNSREDVLNTLYDIFADEGIKIVYNGGNWIDGEFRGNKNEIFVFGSTNQLKYCARNFPHRPGIVTKYVVGDDHEGWYTQREGMDVGDYLQKHRKEDFGYDDLEYLGYAEADIPLSLPEQEHQSYMRVLHAGGGTAYALSYTVQKIVESYQGGEKPSIILVGHYHKLDYSFPREVHAIQLGTTCDQTLFMRKNKIQAMLGGGIVTARRAPDGIINRVQVEFITFFDKGFYIGKDKYWKK